MTLNYSMQDLGNIIGKVGTGINGTKVLSQVRTVKLDEAKRHIGNAESALARARDVDLQRTERTSGQEEEFKEGCIAEANSELELAMRCHEVALKNEVRWIKWH